MWLVFWTETLNEGGVRFAIFDEQSRAQDWADAVDASPRELTIKQAVGVITGSIKPWETSDDH